MADFCIVQLGLFIGNHQAIVNHHLLAQALHQELFPDNWKLARDNLALILSASSKEMALPEPEQKMMSHFVMQAMGESA